MSYITKPQVRHPGLPKNRLGLTRRDYEGSMSTLCAGCGHDSVTASLIHAFWELDIEPHKAVKVSGIGCSGKTTAYFMKETHGFNAVHGRMPSIATGALAANRDLTCIGISGDGDSLSIGLGQFCHAIRRNLNMLYVMENNGVYGLTKGQFSASADVGSKAKKGAANRQNPIDPVLLALTLGCSFVARSFSGDKEQLIPILKAGLTHKGFGFIDVISPCVTFNDHEGSTKSYLHTREAQHDLAPVDFVPLREEITSSSPDGSVRDVRMHDGSTVRFRKMEADYDPSDRTTAYETIQRAQDRGEVPTGLFYIDQDGGDEFHEVNGTSATPLAFQKYEDLCPGSDALAKIQARMR